LNDVVDEEIDALPTDMLARFHHIGQMIRNSASSAFESRT
jgi:hypothetical protein